MDEFIFNITDASLNGQPQNVSPSQITKWLKPRTQLERNDNIMNKQEDLNKYEQVPESLWKEAVRKWYDKIHSGYILSGADQTYEHTVKYAATINWSPCRYCFGPCGDGACDDYDDWDDDDDPPIYPPFPWEKAVVTECTYCPVNILHVLYHPRHKIYAPAEAYLGSYPFIPGTTTMLTATPLGGSPVLAPGQVPMQAVPQQMPGQARIMAEPDEGCPF